MTAITLSDLSKSYPTEDGNRLHVLDGVSLSVSDGEFVSVLGPSGCGKTTLLHVVAGLTEPDEGRVVRDAESRIGFVFQEPRLLEWRTVGENLAFALGGAPVPEAEYDRRIDQAIERVGLDGFRDAYPRSLSGGMQQRVALARAFCIDPDVLLMDEPFASVDEITARELRSDLLELWREDRVTVLFVTHHVREAIVLSDVVAVLSRRPAAVRATIEIESPRPRDLDDEATVRYQRRLLSELEA